jgi:hypothetical protein
MKLEFVPGVGCTVRWSAEPGLTYNLLYRNKLDQGPGTLLTQVTSTGEEAVFLDTDQVSERYYPVRIAPWK